MGWLALTRGALDRSTTCWSRTRFFDKFPMLRDGFPRNWKGDFGMIERRRKNQEPILEGHGKVHFRRDSRISRRPSHSVPYRPRTPACRHPRVPLRGKPLQPPRIARVSPPTQRNQRRFSGQCLLVGTGTPSTPEHQIIAGLKPNAHRGRVIPHIRPCSQPLGSS